MSAQWGMNARPTSANDSPMLLGDLPGVPPPVGDLEAVGVHPRGPKRRRGVAVANGAPLEDGQPSSPGEPEAVAVALRWTSAVGPPEEASSPSKRPRKAPLVGLFQKMQGVERSWGV